MVRLVKTENSLLDEIFLSLMLHLMVWVMKMLSLFQKIGERKCTFHIHIEKYEAAVVETKLGPEETTRDIPNVSEEDLSES